MQPEITIRAIKQNTIKDQHLTNTFKNIISSIRANFINLFINSLINVHKNKITQESFERYYLDQCSQFMNMEDFIKINDNAKNHIYSNNYFYGYNINNKYIPALINTFQEKTDFFLFEEIDKIINYILSYGNTPIYGCSFK